MKKAFLAIALLAAVPCVSLADEEFFDETVVMEMDLPLKTSLFVYALGQDFQWKEYDAGTLLLTESGDFYGGGALATFEKGKRVYRLRGEYFQGEVDYDGGTWAGTPVTTKVNYYGVLLEGDAGIKFGGGWASVEPFWGLGLRWWRRDLENSSAGYGYLEKWHSVYVKAGARAELELGPVVPFVEAAARLGIFNNNVADFGFTEVSTNPGGEVTPYAEAGLSIGPLTGSVYYEQWNFSMSDVAPAPGLGLPSGWGVVQPQTRSRIYGARVGITF